MSREHYHSWTEDRISEVKRLWIDGQSAGDIAKALGGGVTRNAIIGKIHRLGLSNAGRAIPTIAKAPKHRRPSYGYSTNRPPRPGTQNRPAVIHGQKLGVDFTNDPDEADRKREMFRKDGLSMNARVAAGAGVESPNARPFVEHRRGCRWPIGPAGAVMLCCNPVARGSYCAGHAAVAYLDSRSAFRTESQVTGAARLFARFDRIDLEADHRIRHGKSPPRPLRDAAGPTPWDEARDAA